VLFVKSTVVKFLFRLFPERISAADGLRSVSAIVWAYAVTVTRQLAVGGSGSLSSTVFDLLTIRP